ncbi:Selenide, water dikinase [Halioglobus japonicus]|nr:Selenide, water dikinase [Halioglobus japonicus]
MNCCSAVIVKPFWTGHNGVHSAQFSRDLVLVGGGHSHVLALRMMAMAPIAGLRITLISPASHSPYSGMLPGLISGHYSFEQAHIDLARLCQWAGVRFITAEVIGLDTAEQRLKLAGRPTIAYDVVSIDIGSQPELDTVPGARQHAIPVKPVAQLWQRWQDLCWRIAARASGENVRLAVVGGGAGSVELVLAMAHKLQAEPVGFDLYSAAPEILPGYSARARRSVMTQLQRLGIGVHCNARIAAVDSNDLTLADGTCAKYDELFWCTGAAPAPWIASSGLATDERGFLAVRDTLQATHDDRVFGAGDIAVQVNYPRPKAGVYAVRQGPVLAHNLRAFLLHKALRQHRPQLRFLSLLSLGEKVATADKGIFTATGHWVWRWKNWIDRKFMARFEDLPQSMEHGRPDTLPELPPASQQAVCGGCGAKVGADALSAALAQLGRDYPRHCAGTGDDAAVLPATPGVSVVQSLDVLREIVSDPWQMGRIAAQHALSDLYACAARPVSALAAVTLPFASGAMLQRELEQLLAGALHEFAAADCRLLGGHSMQGAELSLGFVVNGVPMDRGGKLLSKIGAQPGDKLVLTKALGTGTVFASHMQLMADGRDVSTATAAMLRGNREAAQLALTRGARACTDITGFGLLGHLLEMLAGEYGAHLVLSQLPILDGALEHIRAGRVSTMHAANMRSAGERLQYSSTVDEARRQMLFDPQTSGGLLIAQPGESAQALCDAMRRSGYGQASIIGEVTAPVAGASPSVSLE